MSSVVLDDHLLRDFLEGAVGSALRRAMQRREIATTNLYLCRLARAAITARGGALLGGWSPERRRALAEQLAYLPESVAVLPMRGLAFRMATIAEDHRVSTLGAEAVAAAETLGARLLVWDGDDGPRIRAAAAALGVRYLTVAR